MNAGLSEQRNRYKGFPARAWITLRLTAVDGTAQELQLLVDTGSPCALIISQAAMDSLIHSIIPDMQTNFGLLRGGWLHISMPELSLDLELNGYANDGVVAGAKVSSPDFEGLVGLPLLRLFEYGGDLNWFWLRR